MSTAPSGLGLEGAKMDKGEAAGSSPEQIEPRIGNTENLPTRGSTSLAGRKQIPEGPGSWRSNSARHTSRRPERAERNHPHTAGYRPLAHEAKSSIPAASFKPFEPAHWHKADKADKADKTHWNLGSHLTLHAGGRAYHTHKKNKQ